MPKRKQSTPAPQPAKGKRYTKEEIQQVVTFARTHGVTAAAKHFEMSPPTLYRWLGQAKAPAPVEQAPAPAFSVGPARTSRSDNHKAVVNLLTIAVDLPTARTHQA
ncbi:MAG: hypothetical protein ACK6CY_13350 [Gemmatimonadota bacterium]|jgi:transposase-like protein